MYVRHYQIGFRIAFCAVVDSVADTACRFLDIQPKTMKRFIHTSAFPFLSKVSTQTNRVAYSAQPCVLGRREMRNYYYYLSMLICGVMT